MGDLIGAIRGFKPQSTIFEIAHRKSSSSERNKGTAMATATAVMKLKRRTHDAIIAQREAEAAFQVTQTMRRKIDEPEASLSADDSRHASGSENSLDSDIETNDIEGSYSENDDEADANFGNPSLDNSSKIRLSKAMRKRLRSKSLSTSISAPSSKKSKTDFRDPNFFLEVGATNDAEKQG